MMLDVTADDDFASLSTPDAAVTRATLRVAHVVRPAQGGMVTQVRTLIAAMPDVCAQVAAPSGVLRGLGRDRESVDLALPDRLSPRGLDFPRWGQKIGAWARRARVELLHGHGVRWSPLFWLAARRARIPYLLTIHNLLPDSRAGRLALRFFLARARQLIAVSDAVAEGVRALLGRNAPVTTIPNGIDLRPFDTLDSGCRATIRAKLSLTDAAPIALCVARLSPEKNVGAFIEAAAKIAKIESVPQARFLIAGDGPERAMLAAKIDALGLRECVTLLGARDDVPALMNAADVVCVPSRAEGFGLVAVEAMAARRPVVATSVGGLPEVVVDGETGRLVREDQIADAMAGLLTNADQARALGAAGRARAEARFGAAAMARTTRAVYDEVLAR